MEPPGNPGRFSSGPKVGDVFALLLVSRSKEKAGLIDEIAVGVVDSNYASFLFYEPLQEFMAGHGDAPPKPSPAPEAAEQPKPAVKLKSDVKPFVPPEAPVRKDGKKSG